MGYRVDAIEFVAKDSKDGKYGPSTSSIWVRGYRIDVIRRAAIDLILSGKVKDASKVPWTRKYPKGSYQVGLVSGNDNLRDIGESTVGTVAYINGVFYYENPRVYKSLCILNMNGTLGKKVSRIRW